MRLLSCADFHNAGFVFECCGSCHNEDDEHTDDCNPPIKSGQRKYLGKICIFGNCCGWNAMKFTRNDWAKVMKHKLQAWRRKMVYKKCELCGGEALGPTSFCNNCLSEIPPVDKQSTFCEDEIRTLKARVEKLEKALDDFTKLPPFAIHADPDSPVAQFILAFNLAVEFARRAREGVEDGADNLVS